MIVNYTRPQTEIYQILETTANPTLDRIHAVVVGPAYIHADLVADNLVYDTYQQDGQYSYQLLRDGELVTKGVELLDSDSVSLVAKNLRIELFTGNIGFEAAVDDPTGNVLVAAVPFLDTEDPSVAIEFDAGRPPTAGDIYQITDDVSTIERQVTGILGQDIVPSEDFSSYVGALPFTLSTPGDNEITVVSSNFTYTALTETSATGADVSRYLRRFGKAGLGAVGGLRLSFDLTCTSGAGEHTTWTFAGTINGVQTDVTVAPDGPTDMTVEFAIPGAGTNLEYLITGYAEAGVATGDRFTFTVDYIDEALCNPIASKFDSGLTLTGYTYADAVRRVASALTIEVTAITDADATTFRVYDSAGLMTPVVFTTASGANIDQDLDYDGGVINLSLTAISPLNFHVGQKFTYVITPPTRSTTVFDKVRLNASVGSTLDGSSPWTITAYQTYNGTLPEIEPVAFSTNYEVAEDALTINTLKVSVAGYPDPADSVRSAVDGIGTVAVQWRAALAVGDSDGLVPIDSVADITTNFLSDGLNSELGYGLAQAFSGSQGKRVYGLNTGGPSVEAFTEAFAKLESANYIYSVAAVTEDEDVMALAAAHCEAMSLPTVKYFRRAYVGSDSPGEYPILDVQADTAPYTASIEQGVGGLYNLAVFQQEIEFAAYTFTRGDYLEIAGGDRFLIDSVDAITLTGGIQSIAVNLQEDVGFAQAAVAARIIAADTAANTGRYIWKRSERLGAGVEQDRRICHIWQDGGTLGGDVIPNRFGACEMAGLRTALQPQQGLTHTEVSYIDACPAMYTKFRNPVLDEMASHGVWIIAQNSAEGPCYVRHQLTTAVSNGSLYYEDNAGTNVDTVCFMLDDITAPLIGKRNATSRTVLEIRGLCATALTALTKEPYDSIIGSQIVSFFNKNGDLDSLDVEIDPVFKDRINITVGLEIPLPLNNIRIYVKARTIKNDGLVITSVSTSATA